MENGWMDWIEWMWKVDGKWMWIEWMWMWKVESGAVPDLTEISSVINANESSLLRTFSVTLESWLWLGWSSFNFW